MVTTLSDLDELILRCKDEQAKKYIREAVSCYKVGAFRSSIVATWIAIVFDFLDKLRELSLTGDKKADAQLEEFEKARRDKDIPKALKFEKNILELARDEFELISHVEFLDLERLSEDRNRCAHPSMVSKDETFDPPAELARLHIRNAVCYLLQHPPVQGKHALDRLMSDISSEYFPKRKTEAIQFLSVGPLKRPRDSLVTNFTILLLKRCLKEEGDFNFLQRSYCALNAVRELHPNQVNETLAKKLSGIIRGIEDKSFYRVLRLLFEVEDIWQLIDVDIQRKIEQYVEKLPEDKLYDIGISINFLPLSSFALKRLSTATAKELQEASFFIFVSELHPEIVNRFIDIYIMSANFAEANNWAKSMIEPWIRDINLSHFEKIIKGACDNRQVLDSNKFKSLISTIYNHGAIEKLDMENILRENDLDNLIQ